MQIYRKIRMNGDQPYISIPKDDFKKSEFKEDELVEIIINKIKGGK